MNYNRCPRVIFGGISKPAIFINYRMGPIKKGLGVWGGQIHTAVTHGMTKIVVPVSAVNTIVFVKKHCVGNIGEVIIGVVVF